jgi:putative SOS response-associated peptidase YedK
MAGIWNLWKNPKTDKWGRTFAILTGEPNELIAPIHHRMTAYLEPQYYEQYLAPAEHLPVLLSQTLPVSKMKMWVVDATPI